MELLKTIIGLLEAKMTIPTSYGWFHLMWIALMVVAAVVLCRTHKDGDERRIRRVVFVSAVLVSILEIYKQFIFSFSVSGDEVVFNYQWYVFPFQFCSMPMYVGLLTGVFKKGKIHDALNAFLATYAIFGGLTVMVYPPQVFVSTIGINIQTMFCHASMIAVGVYLFYTGYVKAEHKTILKAAAVFAVAMAIAMVLNEVGNAAGLNEGGSVFNMFYISPYCTPTLPVYSILQGILPYPVCIAIYYFGFNLIAYIILLAAIGLKRLGKNKKD